MDTVYTGTDVKYKTKAHIAGGVLVSAALLFGGLAVTVVTLKDETHELEEF